MKKVVVLFSVFCLIFQSGIGQDHESSLLWKVTGEGLAKPSYLFGTIHAICPEELVLSPTIESTVIKSDLVILELDMDDPNFMMEMQRLSFNENMKNISEDLSPEDLALIDDFLMKNYNTEMSQVGIFKPMALMSMVLLKSFKCPMTKSIEEFVLKFAVKNDKEIKGLETVADQMGIFDEIPEDKQIEWIIDIIKDSVGTKEINDKFGEAYMKGDVDAIFEISQEVYPEMKEYEDRLLFDRNEKWIPDMIAYMKENPTFFAVGAGHLGGEKGLIKLLRAEGFSVDPIVME